MSAAERLTTFLARYLDTDGGRRLPGESIRMIAPGVHLTASDVRAVLVELTAQGNALTHLNTLAAQASRARTSAERRAALDQLEQAALALGSDA